MPNLNQNLRDIKELLKLHKKELDELKVKSLKVFGSVARGDNDEKSDIDFLVEFSEPVGLFTLSGVRLLLKDLFKCEIDLVTMDAVRDEFKEEVLKEAKVAA